MLMRLPYDNSRELRAVAAKLRARSQRLRNDSDRLVHSGKALRGKFVHPVDDNDRASTDCQNGDVDAK